jgi:UPF0755 protein
LKAPRRKKKKRVRKSTPPLALSPKKPSRMARVTVGIAVVAFGLTVLALVWLGSPKSGSGHAVDVVVTGDRAITVEHLVDAGVVDRPLAFRALLFILAPFTSPVVGVHFLADDLTPGEVVRRLGRLTSRAQVRVVVPEGFNRFQIADRLDASGVCSRRSFDASAVDGALTQKLGISGSSVEGYLFPATYEFFADDPADAVIAEMFGEASRRWASLADAHADALDRLKQKYGWGQREILTLASVVEKEAAKADERPVIASVFYNRLDSADFRPPHVLQSDPTAGYGCLVAPELESCRGYAGHVTPAIVRDAGNAYNTYRHAGLPPGPIANPGLDSVAAVLLPATTDYLFFVATGEGRHAFSHSLDEHEAAIHRPR